MTSLFAWRYFKAKKSTNAINIIAWISVIAITIVTAALIVVLSVFNGFEGLVKKLYGDFYSDLKVVPNVGKTITIDDSLNKKLRDINSIKFIEPVIEEKAILINDDYRSTVTLRGVNTSYENASRLPQHIIRGAFEIGSEEKPLLVLGAGIENALGIVADKNPFAITVYVPNRKATSHTDPIDALQSRNAGTSGTFVIQQEFDNQYAFTNLSFLQSLLQMDKNEYNALEIYLINKDESNKVQQKLQSILGDQFKVQNRYQLNQNLYAAMQIEKVIIFAVAFLILFIASFNIIGALSMLVLEKQRDIAVLQALGAEKKWIQAIFLKEGLLLTILGGIAGIIISILVCIGQSTFHWIKLGGSSFIIDYYPVEMRYTDFLLVILIILAIGFIAAWMPSRKIDRKFISLKS